MKRRHSMPFGVALLAQGIRFRLWAPAAHCVELLLGPPDCRDAYPMQCLADGWFELIVPHAKTGDLYCYRLDKQTIVPDPASRFNPNDVHRESQVIDPDAFEWRDGGWRGQRWENAVVYELHVGCFTPEGTFEALERRLDYLNDLGVTVIELMPVADFPGERNWGYDGVLPFAPDSRYGSPRDLKLFIESAHRKGMMVFLDVVYNHFGPEGNYLHRIAPPFFSERHRTPWGSAINFDGPDSRTVRDFFIHNALYWLEEFHFDGLRLDAVHAILDDSEPDFPTELARAVQERLGQNRCIHLIVENNNNSARYLERDEAGSPRRYAAQWNDDIHHVLHYLVSGESDGYYADYACNPMIHLGRCLTQGFSYQGQPSRFHGGKPRGEASAHLPPAAFITFLQNHDQIGNRAYGERLSMFADPAALRAAIAIMLLAPQPPLLFMGEEFAASQVFQFFCDFGPELAAAVTMGRRQEFAGFHTFDDMFDGATRQDAIPDPCDRATFLRSKLDWREIGEHAHARHLSFYRNLLALRRKLIVPRLPVRRFSTTGENAKYRIVGERGLIVHWRLHCGSTLILLANLGATPQVGFERPAGDLFYASGDLVHTALDNRSLTPWSVAWVLETGCARM